ncbi:hypothetical protein [Streptomyces tailanensis]|uniref:hypothetical protein n=1 Tax=Streptomyces tailanensis TaxID=2569858 RepID=UPI00122E03DB|nr:hypothetical protein [Streptomyces tailanensis]
MAAGGFCRLPDGNVVVALNLPGTTTGGVAVTPPPRPAGGLPGPAAGEPHSAAPGAVPYDGSVRVLVLAGNRARALTRLRNLGLRAIYLRGNAAPPTPDEVTAVLHHPDGLIWRTSLAASQVSRTSTAPELWRPIRALLRRPPVRV